MGLSNCAVVHVDFDHFTKDLAIATPCNWVVIHCYAGVFAAEHQRIANGLDVFPIDFYVIEAMHLAVHGVGIEVESEEFHGVGMQI